MKYLFKNIKQKAGIFGLYVAIMLGLTGCPYDSEIPLSDPQKSLVDTLLIGQWILKEKNKVIELNINDFNGKEYFIEYKAINSDGIMDITFLRGFNTIIDKITIININELEKNIEYTYFKYKAEEDKLIVAYISDDFIKNQFSVQHELLDFVRKNLKNEALFEKEIVFIKKR